MAFPANTITSKPFAEVGLIAGTRYNEHGHADAGMGVDFGDYNRDGDADLFVTNFAFETNALYHNAGWDNL